MVFISGSLQYISIHLEWYLTGTKEERIVNNHDRMWHVFSYCKIVYHSEVVLISSDVVQEERLPLELYSDFILIHFRCFAYSIQSITFT